MKSLEEQFATTMEENIKLKQGENQLNDKITKFTTSEASTNEQIKLLKQDNSWLTEELSRKKVEFAKFEAELKKIQEKNNELQNGNKALQKSKELNNSLQQQIKTLENKVASLESDLHESNISYSNQLESERNIILLLQVFYLISIIFSSSNLDFCPSYFYYFFLFWTYFLLILYRKSMW